jgi:hypothetical protein
VWGSLFTFPKLNSEGLESFKMLKSGDLRAGALWGLYDKIKKNKSENKVSKCPIDFSKNGINSNKSNKSNNQKNKNKNQ